MNNPSIYPEFPRRPLRGFSLMEMLVVVAVIGVLAGLAIPVYSSFTDRARDTEAEDFAESLNRAVANFVHANWTLPVAPNASGTEDEFTVLRSIQYDWKPKKKGVQALAGLAIKPGAPYFSPRYNPSPSSNSNVHRLRWNGQAFEVLRPGTAGTGLLKTFTGADHTPSEYVFPEGYKPAGMR